MKLTILLLAFSTAIFTGCSTAYKTGQTPDDVYYSAAKPQQDNVDTDKDKDEDLAYHYDDTYYDDRYLRMKVHNLTRWNDLNDWYYYEKYSHTYHYYYGTYSNPYSTWNYYYNPYCCCHNSVGVINPKISAAAPLIRRNFSLAGYTHFNYNNTNGTSGNTKTPVRTSTRSYNNSNSDRIRTIVKDDNSGNGSSRTYTPSSGGSNGGNNSNGSSGNSGTKSGGSSGGSVTRPVRN